jgi:hypothetical protein
MIFNISEPLVLAFPRLLTHLRKYLSHHGNTVEPNTRRHVCHILLPSTALSGPDFAEPSQILNILAHSTRQIAQDGIDTIATVVDNIPQSNTGEAFSLSALLLHQNKGASIWRSNKSGKQDFVAKGSYGMVPLFDNMSKESSPTSLVDQGQGIAFICGTNDFMYSPALSEAFPAAAKVGIFM